MAMRPKTFLIYAFLVLSLLVMTAAGCSRKIIIEEEVPLEQESTDKAAGAEQKAKSSCNNSEEFPDIFPATGQFRFRFQSDLDICTVEAYAVGAYRDGLKLARRGDEILLYHVPPGSYDVMIFARQKAKGDSTIPIGVRLNGLVIEPGKMTAPGLVTLSPLASLSGTVSLYGSEDLLATQVALKGTGVEVKTDAKGQFVLPNLPVGLHQLEVKRAGYVTGTMSYKVTNPTESQSLPPFSLLSDGETSGLETIVFGNRLTKVESRTVPFTIKGIEALDPTEMMLSDREDFLSAVWQPFSSYASFQFSRDGEMTLYAKIKDRSGVELVLSAPILIAPLESLTKLE